MSLRLALVDELYRRPDGAPRMVVVTDGEYEQLVICKGAVEEMLARVHATLKQTA